MHSISSLVSRVSVFRREEMSEIGMSDTMMNLLIALLVLVFVALALVGSLYVLRKVRRARAIARQTLPSYNESTSTSNHQSHQRRLTITTSPYGRSSICVYDEKSSMVSDTSPPLSPSSVPEIRITFPDEQDDAGRRKSGRVVVVRVGENGVGLEPLKDEEQLPAYQRESGQRFHSIDMDRIGGLKEKPTYS